MIKISPPQQTGFTDNHPRPYSYRVCGGATTGPGAGNAFVTPKASFKDQKSQSSGQDRLYGQGLADETKKAMNAAGKQEVFSEAITPGEKDYTAIVSRLKQNGIDVVFLGGYHTEAGLIIRQMRAQGMKTILIGGGCACIERTRHHRGATMFEGTMMTFSPDPRKNPASKEVVVALEKKGINPEGYVVYAYAAIQAWAQAAEKAHSADGAKDGGCSELHRVRYRARKIQVRRQGRS